MEVASFLSNQNNNRIFIFQSSCPLTNEHIDYINDKLNIDFFPDWFSHRDKITPELLIIYRHFIIISTCKNNISGCSIDSLIQQMKIINSELSIDLFNRLNIAYCSANNETFKSTDNLQISFLSYREFLKNFSQNRPDDIYVFNNTISYSDQIWIEPLDQWLSNHVN